MSDVTLILQKIERGDRQAAADLLPIVYEELRKLAASRMSREGANQTLSATSLVHEAYVRLVDVKQVQEWDSRGHFFAAAAEAMRRILIERARRRHRRGEIIGPRVPIEDLTVADSFPDNQLLALNDSLEDLHAFNSEIAQVVKLRFFAGLKMSEVASALGISLRAAERHWTFARTWLHREMEQAVK